VPTLLLLLLLPDGPLPLPLLGRDAAAQESLQPVLPAAVLLPLLLQPGCEASGRALVGLLLLLLLSPCGSLSVVKTALNEARAASAFCGEDDDPPPTRLTVLLPAVGAFPHPDCC